MDISFLTQRPPRHHEVIGGVVSLLAGIALLLISSFIYYRLAQRGYIQSVVLIASIVTLMGVMLTSAGIRLLSSRSRPDGGLFSPLVLFIGGLFFIFGPFYIFWHHTTPMLGLAPNLVAGVACFVICWRRIRQRYGSGT